MQYRKEPCRNFQRGFCQYGDRCKFLHATPQKQQQSRSGTGNPFGFGSNNQQQQQKPNPFGFGSNNQQQQKSNPFGFGVHGSSQSKGPGDFGNKQSQFKPFENKWSRFSPLANGGSGGPSSKQPENQSQAANHKCTDPEACKKLIAEDFQNERPLWKLTCYSHWKHAPCDITGDVSYEELRASAYEDAKRGLNLQSIVEKERNKLNSKLMEFEKLLHSPYVPPSAHGHQSPVPGDGGKTPPAVSSFGQLGTSLNTGFGVRPSAPSNNPFGQPDAFPSPTQNSGAFGSVPSNNPFGQPNAFPSPTQNSGAFGANGFPSGNSGGFGSQLPNQGFVSSFPSNNSPGFGSQLPNQASASSFPSNNTPGFGSQLPNQASASSFPSNNIPGFGSQPPNQALGNSFPSNNSGFGGQFPNQASPNTSGFGTSTLVSAMGNQFSSSIASNGPHSTSGAVAQVTSNVQSTVPKESSLVDPNIWLKEKWSIGEIPEEAPPSEYVW